MINKQTVRVYAVKQKYIIQVSVVVFYLTFKYGIVVSSHTCGTIYHHVCRILNSVLHDNSFKQTLRTIIMANTVKLAASSNFVLKKYVNRLLMNVKIVLNIPQFELIWKRCMVYRRNHRQTHINLIIKKWFSQFLWQIRYVLDATAGITIIFFYLFYFVIIRMIQPNQVWIIFSYIFWKKNCQKSIFSKLKKKIMILIF